jgi:ABC-type transport system involved in multi-copper enzyme maturation permease subunit
MIWLTWRQFRSQAVTAATGLALFAVLLLLTRSRMAGLYAASGMSGCHGACAGIASAFLNQLASTQPFTGHSFDPLPGGFNLYPFVYVLGTVLILTAPAVIGCFWGAPLIARELETGSGRLAWSQSVTRTRWLTVKLVATGAAAMALTEAFALLLAWWATPIARAMGAGGSGSVFSGNRFSPVTFATHGITPIGYAAFGFALGVTAGLLIRRTVPAMAVTLVVFAAVQLAVPLWVRPHLLPAAHTTQAIGRDITLSTSSSRGAPPASFSLTTGGIPGQPGAWVITSGAVDRAGHAITAAPAACAAGLADGKPGLDCLAQHGIQIAASYQPASRYWPLQSIETGLFLAAALALAGLCYRQLGRRRS